MDTESGSYSILQMTLINLLKEKSIASNSFKIKVEFDDLVNAEPIAFLQWSDAKNNVIFKFRSFK